MTPDVLVGQVVAGKYRIDSVIGEGGMGYVVVAHHLQLDTRVAIKLLRAELASNAEAVERFAREARAAVRITSPHVARVFDVGTLESGAPYMVMEFLEGGDLSNLLQKRGPLPIQEAIDYLLEACEAIAEAHAAGIVHRDLKPANLFCARRPDGSVTIKVLDFGISKLTGNGPGGLNHTKTTAIMGSPFYMSPEQMESTRGVDIRTDIWGLGVILYELVTGKTPFEGNALPEVCLRVATQQPAPMRTLRADAPAALELVILRCLEKDRDKRYGNVARLAVALRELASSRGRQSVDTILRTIEASGQPVMSGAPPGTGPTEPAPPPGLGVGTIEPLGKTQIPQIPMQGSKRTLAIAGGVGALVLIGVIALRIAQSNGPPPAATLVSSAMPAAPAAATAAPLPAATAAPGPAQETPPATSALPSGDPSAPAAPRPAAATNTAANNAPANAAKKTTSPPAAKAPSTAKPKANCDPNFYLDAQGEKHFKPECFH
jgi:eukaryotic-like serine/threonine-protein kinase